MDDKLWGKYRAFVVDHQDPEQRARLKLRIPAVLGDAPSEWALPCLPFGGMTGSGWYAVPEVNAQVWAEFEAGDVNRPLWVGTFWQQAADVPLGQGQSQAEPATRLLKTPAGHLLQCDDTAGQERLRLRHPSGAELLIDEDGSLCVTDKAGARVSLDASDRKLVVEDSQGNTITLSESGIHASCANGNHIDMASSGITLKGQRVEVDAQQLSLAGGSEPLVLGTSFMSLFNLHTHPSSTGPTGPPAVPMTPSSLSSKVMTS